MEKEERVGIYSRHERGKERRDEEKTTIEKASTYITFTDEIKLCAHCIYNVGTWTSCILVAY